MTRRSGGDPADLGRGPLTRWLPVWWQAPPDPPAVEPFTTESDMTPKRFLLRVIFSAKRLTIPAAVFASLQMVGSSLVPVLMGLAIDRALATGDPGELVLWLVAIAVDFLLIATAGRFAQQLMFLAGQRVQHRLRTSLSRVVLHPVESDRRQLDGAVVSLMTNDVMRVAAVGLGVYPIAEFAAIGFIAVSLLWISWPLGLFVLLGAPVVVWLMGALSGRLARDSRVYQTLLATTVGRATDLVAGYRVIKGIRAETEATRRYRESSGETLTGVYRNLNVLGRFITGSNAVSGGFVAAVAGLAALFAVNGDLTVGGLIAAVGLAQALIPQMSMLATNAVPAWAAAVACSGRVFDALSETPAVGATVIKGKQSSNKIDERPSALDHREPPPAVELSLIPRGFRVEPGELVGVRADDRTAAALAQALLNPHAITNGIEVTVTVDGTSAQQVEHAEYRRQVVVAPHDSTLFSGTIADNLDIPGAPPELREAALRAAACDDFVTDATGGQDAEVGEMGNRLSGGQRQRVALARALARDAPLLVLHDPTTAVDSVTEAKIADGLRDLRKGRSTILIASSPALLAVCDRVIELSPDTAARAAVAEEVAR